MATELCGRQKTKINFIYVYIYMYIYIVVEGIELRASGVL
jgi:hypothetical protein